MNAAEAAIARVLTPEERTALVVGARYGGDLAKMRREWPGCKTPPALEQIRAWLDGAREKIAALKVREEPRRAPSPRPPDPPPFVAPRAPRPRRPERKLPPLPSGPPPVPVAKPQAPAPAVEPRGSSPSAVTLLPSPPTVTREPEEAVMAAPVEHPAQPVSIPETGAPEGIADRFVREAKDEAASVVSELIRLRFRADQCVRVLRQLGLPVPPELEAILHPVAAVAVPPVAPVADLRPVPPPAPAPEPPPATEPSTPALPPAAAVAPPETGQEQPPAAQPDKPKMTPQERGAAGAAAAAQNRTFLDAPAPEHLRREEDIEAALREMGTDISSKRILEEWKLGSRASGERVIRHFYEKGLLVLQELPTGQGATLKFKVGAPEDSAFAKLPVPAGGWEQIPVWTQAERKTLMLEVTARQAAALVAVMEEVGKPLVPKEVMEELAKRYGVEIPQARVADYLREMTPHGTVIRTGKMRRAKGQTAGRTSVEYRPVVVRRDAPDAPAAPAAAPEPPKDNGKVIDPNDLAKVRDWVVKQKQPFNVEQAVEATLLTEEVVRAGLSALIARQVVAYVGMDDLELYEYQPPTGPGKAAETDAKRRRQTTARERSLPVDGTGHNGQFTPHKPTNDLLKQCEKAGAKVEKTGSGHFAVLNPATRQRVIVGSTEGSGSNNKTKKRLADIGITL